MPITKLPAPSQRPPSVPSGTVILFRDNDWKSESLTLTTAAYAEGKRHSFSGKSFNDKASWVGFNLPVGTVMTLIQNDDPEGPKGCSDLANAGKVVDLVGTGQIEAVDLTKINANDCISAFFWREVALDMGAIELFEDTNFGGNRTVLFLQEWPMETLISVNDWYIADKASSAKWDTLRDTQSADLFADIDGRGKSYGNIRGFGGDRKEPNFGDGGFQDKVSSFKWHAVVPYKEVIKSVTAPLTVSGDSGSQVASGSGRNDSPTAQPVSVGFTESSTDTVTVSTSVAATLGTKLTSATKATGGVPGVGAVETTITFELSYSVAVSESKSESKSVSTTRTVSRVWTCPAYSRWEGKLTSRMGTVPPTKFETAATRWYTQQLPGTTEDPAVITPNGAKTYKRDEKISGTIQAALALTVYDEFKSYPL